MLNKKRFLGITIVVITITSILFIISQSKITSTKPDVHEKQSDLTTDEFNPDYFPEGSSTTEVSPEALNKVFGVTIDKSRLMSEFSEYLFKINGDNKFEYKASFFINKSPVELVGYNFDIDVETDSSDKMQSLDESLSIYYLNDSKVIELKKANPNVTFHIVDRDNNLSLSQLKTLISELVKF